ncbi:MAG: ABC transporter ATP-binding protein [Planctomycetes bacterium]|nr:ABC transporter ATP-binding protein [Planctomycetota bacterium]
MKPEAPPESRPEAILADPDSMVRSFGLTKLFGRRRALDGIELDVRRGDMFGLIGGNGAGKTTFFRLAATLIPPTAGRLYVARHGVTQWPGVVRHALGYLPDHFGIADRVPVHVYLEFFALLVGIPAPERRSRVETALGEVGLADQYEKDLRSLSLGMQQRLALARLLLRRPALLLLDEPLSGLDPRARAETLEVLRRLNGAGHTIVMSTHILPDLDRFCNRIGILEAGRLRFCGTLARARKSLERWSRYAVAVSDRGADAARLVAEAPGVFGATLEAGARPARVTFGLTPPAADPSEVVARLVGAGLRVVQAGREEPSLLDVYLRFTRGKVT